MKIYRTRPCDECPWRRDQPAGRFPPERFAALRSTVREGGLGAPMFACHKAPAGREIACAGYLLVDGTRNNTVRINASVGHIDLAKVRNPDGLALFDSYEEMAAFNGCPDNRRRS